MCLYPQLLENKKYKPNLKNGGNPPKITDPRTRFVPIGCGKCMECRRAKAREWQVRLLEDIKTHKNGKFITMTFSNESIKKLNDIVQHEEEELIQKLTETGKLKKECISKGYERDNRIATKGVRLFLERWRKKYGESVRHWLITELGGNGTENIHLHGIIWTNQTLETVEQKWEYGFVWKGKMENERLINYVNEKTVNYITKYVNKVDELHKEYKPKVLTSKGIGRSYIGTYNSKNNLFTTGGTKEVYRTRSGHKISLPIYWRNKLYTEEQREKLWIQKLDKKLRWVGGEKVDISKGDTEYYKLLKWYQQINKELGYGNGEKNWELERYENQRRDMLRAQRINNTPPCHGEGRKLPTP